MTAMPPKILLVEDNPGHVVLAKEAFREGGLQVDLTVAVDGLEAMAYLRRQPPHEHAARPDLILLDLNLPRKDGRQVLQEIKQDADLRRIPVVVLTTSEADNDIQKCYSLHANSYISKPMHLDGLFTVVRVLQNYWFGLVQLPKR